MAARQDIRQLLENAQDRQYEEEVARNPEVLKVWWGYLEGKKDVPPTTRYIIYERALKFLPGSYKIWLAYLNLRKSRARGKRIDSPKFIFLVSAYERALVTLHKMPRIWLDYLELLMLLKKGTMARRTFDRALQALPITQHDKVWKLYTQWAKDFGVEETAIKVFTRYLMFDPSFREDYVDYLEQIQQYEEAARQLAICVNDEHFVSPHGHSKHRMWMRLCDMCAEHPEEVSGSVNVEPVIRSGISRFSDEVGHLWCRLADYYIRLGQFEKARDVFEEGINSVVTVRDFSLIFDAYTACEESVLTAKMRLIEQEGAGDDDYTEEDALEDANDVELRLARLEYITDKRPVLLNSVVLRQNPHNVHEWHKRAKLFKDDPTATLKCFFEAIEAVDPAKAVGKLSSLHLSLAKFYEQHDDFDSARQIYEKATQVPFKSVEELATVWCNWAEAELRQEQYDSARQVAQRAVTEPKSSIARRKAKARAEGMNKDAEVETQVQDKVHKSVKVWALYLDLEESLGTFETTRAAYDRVMELKVVTPQMLLNYAAYLEEANYFEDSFQVYEKGVSLFEFPHVKPIWLKYLAKFEERYKGTKLERLRDMYEQVIKSVPPKEAAEFYLSYAKIEEKYGLARHAMNVYDRATKAVTAEEAMDMYLLYASKATQFFGVTRSRPIYERAIETLPDEQAKKMCLKFSEVEKKLGEVDRARAVLQHGSQFADPRRDPSYWKAWHEFEVAHGNEDTYKDMLRVKRSVETAFSQVNYMASEMLMAQNAETEPTSVDAMSLRAEADAMQRAHAQAMVDAQKEQAAHDKRKFVSAGTMEMADEDSAAKRQKTDQEGIPQASVNKEEIDIDDVDEDDGGDQDDMQIQTKPVPSTVFGGLMKEAESQDEGKGALERLKSK